jgi:anhydro-N-acetylmuramic acid kinase
LTQPDEERTLAVVIVAGLISGTSMDALDVAVADLTLTDDAITLRPLGAQEHPWAADLRARLLALLPPATTTAGEICDLDQAVGQTAAAAVGVALARFADGRGDLVASHGQTVFHRVVDGHARGTLQLGQPAWIVEATGLPVVSDLRARDIAAGGEGAPLASTLDALWLAGGPPRAALNLGGIANVTVVREGSLLAFDTGPASCLLDAAAQRFTGEPCDRDGRLASAGRVDEGLLARLLAEPYYAKAPPKSTGRELFTTDYVHAPDVPVADLMATLTELTAVTVADACGPYGLAEVVASGGGVRNPALVAALRRRLAPTPLVTADERGLPADAKEAYLVALLGFLTWHQLPGVVPGGTGSAVPRVLGRLSPGNTPLRLPAPAPPPRRLVVTPP